MTEQEIISQLKTLRDISPDREWAALAYSKIVLKRSIFDFFSFSVPKPVAVSAMAAVVAVLGGASVRNSGLVDTEVGNSPALTASLIHVSEKTAQEVAEVQQIAKKFATQGTQGDSKGGAMGSGANAVVFNQDAEERDNFQALLRERIETKIAYVEDLFLQAEDGDSVREILLNQRRYEENFRIFGEGIDGQVKDLLADAKKALLEGDLITALDLVNAIDKLIKN